MYIIMRFYKSPYIQEYVFDFSHSLSCSDTHTICGGAFGCRSRFYAYVHKWQQRGYWVVSLLVQICSDATFYSPTLQYKFPFYCSCFIGDTAVFFGAFLGPIFAVLIFNSVIFMVVVGVLVKHLRRTAKGATDKRNIYHGTIRLLTIVGGLMALFGLTWLFAALTITDSSIAFQVIFAVCNTTQGFFIFLLFCVFNTDARQLWKKTFTQMMLNKTCPRKTPRVTTDKSHQLTARGGTQPSMLKTPGTSETGIDMAAETSVGGTHKPVEIPGSGAVDIEKQDHACQRTNTWWRLSLWKPCI